MKKEDAVDAEIIPDPEPEVVLTDREQFIEMLKKITLMLTDHGEEHTYVTGITSPDIGEDQLKLFMTMQLDAEVRASGIFSHWKYGYKDYKRSEDRTQFELWLNRPPIPTFGDAPAN